MSLHGDLYRAARFANNVHTLAHPSRLPRRVTNVILGRLIRKAMGGGR